MDLLELNKFMVLLWKNFILKRRQFFAIVVEIILTLLFAGSLLLTRKFTVIRKSGPYSYTSQPVDELPSFLRSVPFPGLWELAFVPSKSVVVRDIVEAVKMDLHYNFKVQGFSSESDFEDYVKQENNSERVMVAFVFDHEFKNSHDPLPLKVKYYLRFSSFPRNKDLDFDHPRNWHTGSLFPTSPSVGPRNEQDSNGGSPGYLAEGFLVMQHALDKAIMMYHNRTAAQALLGGVNVFMQRFPYPEYYHDYFLNFLGIFIPLVILFIFSMNHFTLVQSLVWEKENRLKMKPLPIIQHSDPSVVFVFLVCFAIATIFFSFMVSTFFNKASFAVSIGGFIYFATYFPAASISSNFAEMPLIQKLASCLSSNIHEMESEEEPLSKPIEIGIKWSNIFSPSTMENFVFAYTLGTFLLDAVLYGLVAWYIEAVFPGEYGVAKPWNFFLLRSFWFGEKPKKKIETRQFYETTESKYFETEPTHLVAGIQLQHLSKEFRVQNTTKIALKDLSLNLYEGQITVLLGHNGAGKSTTLSILSGLYPATSGEAYINGYDISKQMVQIRKSLGLCPQQDLLFNYLTVSEHLYFYGVVKGIPRKMCFLEIDRMLSTFNLLEKQNAFSESLSGGMKRKLSISIALLGDSKVVILDEPTSGMDPASRRAAWDVLHQYKQDRTILLTTHHMDEADILGDRIAIMVNGSLRCCGSSLFLKKIYGVGYHIIMVKEPHCNVEEISKLIYYHIPSATLEKNIKNELSFILPREYTHSFEALFTDLEKRQAELGIASFGASVTTMEEVFFRVSNMEDLQTDILAPQPQSPSLMTEDSIKNQNRNMSRNERPDSSPVNESPPVMFNTGYLLCQQQFLAMLMKRAMFSWRNWQLVLLQTLALLGSFAFLTETEVSWNSDDEARQMDLGQYGPTVVPFSVSGNSNLTPIFLKHLKSMLESDRHTLKEVQGNLLQYLIENEDCIRLCIVAFSIEATTNEITFTCLFNNQAYHSPSLALAILDNILFMTVSGPDASLTVSNKPQPRVTPKEYSEMLSNEHQVAINIHFGMALFISGFCLLTVTERVSKAKHIQFLSGVYVLAYWLSALLWDLIIFSASCCLLLGVFKYCQLDLFLTEYHFLDTMLIFTLYGWSAIPLMYLLSFLFTKSTSAYIKLVLFNYLSGIFSLLIDSIFEFEMSHSVSNATRTFILKVLLVFPNYNLAKCITYYTTYYQMKKQCSIIKDTAFLSCDKQTLMVQSWESKLMFFRCIIHILYGKDLQKDLSKELSGESEDEDVENERKRILEQPRASLSSTVLIKELTKIYFRCPVILAVRNISTAIQCGDCFGLLGFNGAGKTTTFQMLTGEETATSGEVFLDGFNITKDLQKVKSRIGYCPQTDALLEYMTGREIMIMYARLWGISESQIQLYVNNWLNSLQLEPHADKIIRTYRIEECDAFCTRLAIMVKGKFMCLGSPQHLKNKFGNIYTLKIKVKIDTQEHKLDDLKFFITITFPGSELKQENQGNLNYYIPSKDNSWAKVFGILEDAKDRFDLEDYSISQITLEQVFLTFANPENKEMNV
ncbi:ATP-binding cassette sub-family A member 3 [Pteropus alecto]|uniref:ATP-binding cassette sub-family A member 3 n=1 Tax=Pteropus alecto TaxID=9402 RepID=L5KKF5_PTEAL|nr:ATP-binding cassette sub-family A member 3 [Pteropus alecto]